MDERKERKMIMLFIIILILVTVITVYLCYTTVVLPNEGKCLDYTTWTIIKHGPVWWIAICIELIEDFYVWHGPYTIIKKELKKEKEK
jgi:hypothetical protein